jgi:signal transduction histidine kinase
MLTPVVTGTQTLELMMDSMYQDLKTLADELDEEQRSKLEWAVGGVRDFYKEAMQMVYDGAQDAQERVREIADAIKGIVAQPHFEPTEFAERVESVARVLRLVAERKDIAIDLSGVVESGPMELDRKGIYNALYNLINNAIQAFPDDTRKGVIAVSSRPLEVDGIPGLEVVVRDNGPGMPAHVRERMFTDHAVSTKVGGTGLGTRIVKNVVDAHHGTIRVDSELGKGTFTIWLPMHQPSSRSKPMAA